MEQIITKTEEILANANYPDRHTRFQIEKFIIGKEPTVQSQLWAIVRELKSRKEAVEFMQMDLRDAEDNIELLDIKIQKLDRKIRKLASNEDDSYNDLNIRECELHIRKLQRKKEQVVKTSQSANRKLKGIVEEMTYLIEGYAQITSTHGDIKPLDDEESQREMWYEKLLEEFNLKIILSRPLDPEFVRTILVLPDEAPVRKQMVSLLSYMQKGKASPKIGSRPEAKAIGS